MPSDTFGEVVRKLRSHAEAWKISGTEDREHLIGEEKMAFDCLVAARLLEAAGRECRAGRGLLNDKGQAYINGDGMLREMYRSDRAALDELAPDLSAALTPPTKEKP